MRCAGSTGRETVGRAASGRRHGERRIVPLRHYKKITRGLAGCKPLLGAAARWERDAVGGKQGPGGGQFGIPLAGQECYFLEHQCVRSNLLPHGMA